MYIWKPWVESFHLFEWRSLWRFLRTVFKVSAQAYWIIFYYFWWVLLLLVGYQLRWFIMFGLSEQYENTVVHALSEFIKVFNSGFFFLVLSYVWMITTKRNLPRVVDYFIRLLYFYVPYVILLETALLVEEHDFSLGVVLSPVALIILIFFTFFLLDTYDGFRVPFYAAARAAKIVWYNIPFILISGLLSAALESFLLSVLRSFALGLEYDFLQRMLFFLGIPFIASFFAVFYAYQTIMYPERYEVDVIIE